MEAELVVAVLATCRLYNPVLADWMTMVPIFINGLWPAVDNNPDIGSTVGIFELDRGPDDKILLVRADIAGVVRGDLPDRYVGSILRLVIRKTGFVPISVQEKIQPYGLVYTVRLVKTPFVDKKVLETKVGDLAAWDEFDCEQNYTEAKAQGQEFVREFRFKDRLARVVVTGISIAAIAVGLYVDPIAAAVFGVGAFVLTNRLAPYALGIRKRPFSLQGWRKRNRA